MSAGRNKELEIFSAALDMSPAEREVFLKEACGNDQSLFQRLLSLLQAAGEEDVILNKLPHVTWSMANAVEQPGTQIGRFKILEKIGEGGMGVVYLAEQTDPVSRKVALKIIKIGMDTEQVIARFEAERQALAMMDHPNIAKILDGGVTETGRPYFVMEMVEGLPITSFCDRHELSTAERLRLFASVCQAIQSAHQKGVVHRDIKPSNILVSETHGQAEPKVIDFGVAKALHQKLTEKTLFTSFGQMIGTPAYMSPEQANMGILDVDSRTDVYSLGVLLYELLTGLPPFSAKELMKAGYREMQRIIVEEEPVKPSTRVSTMDGKRRMAVAKSRGLDVNSMAKHCRGDLDWIALKCLEKDRGKRYGTPNELAADIERYLNSEPVSAAAPSFAYVLQKFHQKHKGLVRSAMIVSVVLLIASVISTTLAVRNSQLRKAAEASEQGMLDLTIELEDNLYVSDMLAVETAVEKEEFARAEQLLLQHRSERSGRDLRGLAWRFYWQRTRGDWLHAIQAHDGATNRMVQVRQSVNASAIGRISMLNKSERLLSIGGDGCLRLWDLTGRDLVDEWQIGGGFVVSPNEQFLCFIDSEQRLTVWDLERHRLVRQGREADLKRIRFKFTHDSRYLVVGGSDFSTPLKKGWVRVEEVESGNVVFTPEGYWFDFAVSPAAPLILSTGLVSNDDGPSDREQLLKKSMGYLWDIERKEMMHVPLDVRGVYGMGIRFSPKGTFVALNHSDDPLNTNSDLGVHVFRVATGMRVSVIEEADLGGGNPFVLEYTVAFSSEEEFIAAPPRFASHRIGVWRTDTGEQLALNADFVGSLSALAFHPESDDILIAVSMDKTLLYWNWKEDRIIRRWTGHKSEISALGVGGNGKHVVTGGWDGRLVFWPPHVVNPVNRLPRWIGDPSLPIASRQGRYLLLGEFVEKESTPTKVKVGPVDSLRARRAIRHGVFDVESRERLWRIHLTEKPLGFSTDESAVLTLSTNRVNLRQVRTGSLLRSVNLVEPIMDIAFDRPLPRLQVLSPDATVFASFNIDATVRLVSTATGRTLNTLEEECSAYSFAFGPVSNRVVFGTRDGRRGGVWDSVEDQIVWLDSREGDNLGGLVVSRDERFVAGLDHRLELVRLWNMNTGQLVSKFKTGELNELFFTPDSRTLAGISESREVGSMHMLSTLKLFELRTFRQIADLKSGPNSAWVSKTILSPNGQFLMVRPFAGERNIELMQIPSVEDIDKTVSGPRIP